MLIEDVTNVYLSNKPESSVILKIAGLSAEFKVVNKLLLQNKDMSLENLKFTETIIVRKLFFWYKANCDTHVFGHLLYLIITFVCH